MNELLKHIANPTDPLTYSEALGLLNRNGPQEVDGLIYSLDKTIFPEMGSSPHAWRIVSRPAKSV